MLLRNRDSNDVLLGGSDDEVPAAKAEMAREDGLCGERAVCSVRELPPLLNHVFNAKPQAGAKEVRESEDSVVTLSVCLYPPSARGESQLRTASCKFIFRGRTPIRPKSAKLWRLLETKGAGYLAVPGPIPIIWPAIRTCCAGSRRRSAVPLGTANRSAGRPGTADRRTQSSTRPHLPGTAS